MKCTIVTNNRRIEELSADYDGLKVMYAGDSISEVIRQASTLIQERKMKLLNEPLGGRYSRPFPYLSIILMDSDKPSDYKIWEKLMTCESLNRERKRVYESFSESILEDFSEMDYSFISTALPHVYRGAC